MSRPHPLGRLASYGTPIVVEDEPERTAGGLLESEVEAIMAHRVTVWAQRKTRERLIRDTAHVVSRRRRVI